MIREHLANTTPSTSSTKASASGLTIGPVFTVAQAAHHPHLRARNAFVEIDHPIAGSFEYPRSLVKMTATPPILDARADARRAQQRKSSDALATRSRSNRACAPRA